MKAREISKWISRCLFIIFISTLFFDQESWAQQLQLPLKGEWQPRQHFNVWVGSPVCGRHLAEDIPREEETPVYPIKAGTIKFAKYGPKENINGIGYGVIIEHNLNGEDICSVYFHMREPKANKILTEGEDILAIDRPIGYISGKEIDHNYTYPHLHFGIRKEGYISPYRPDGHDPRTNKWYYPGYTAIYDKEGNQECNSENPYHEQIANQWFDPSDFFSQYLEPSQKFNAGDYVRTTASLNIRTSPEKGGDDNIKSPPSPLRKGVIGYVVEDEKNGTFADGYYWWYVLLRDDMNNEYDGWCAENWLEIFETVALGQPGKPIHIDLP